MENTDDRYSASIVNLSFNSSLLNQIIHLLISIVVSLR